MSFPSGKSGARLEDQLLAALARVEESAEVADDGFADLEAQELDAGNRRSPRLLTQTPVEVHVDGQWVGSSSCRNVCETGMFVEWNKDLGTDTLCEVRLIRHDRVFASFGARVARQTMRGIGLEFRRLDPAARCTISLYDRNEHGALESLFAPAIARYSELGDTWLAPGPALNLTPIATHEK